MSSLQSELECTVRDAKAQIALLQRRLSTLDSDFELEKRKNHDLNEKVAEQSRQYTKLQNLYDRAKKKALFKRAGIVKEDLTPHRTYMSQKEGSVHSTPAGPMLPHIQQRGSFVGNTSRFPASKVLHKGSEGSSYYTDSGHTSLRRVGSSLLDTRDQGPAMKINS